MNAPSATGDFRRLKVRIALSWGSLFSLFCSRQRNYVPSNEYAWFLSKNINSKEFSCAERVIAVNNKIVLDTYLQKETDNLTE